MTEKKSGGKRQGQKCKSLLVWQYLLKWADKEHAVKTGSMIPNYTWKERDLCNLAVSWAKTQLRPYPWYSLLFASNTRFGSQKLKNTSAVGSGEKGTNGGTCVISL